MVHLSGLRAPLESLSAVDGAMASQERELKYLVKNRAENPNWLLPTCEVHERNTPRMARCCVWSPVSYRSRGGTGSCLSWGWAGCMPSTTCRQGWPRRSCLQPCWPHLAGGWSRAVCPSEAMKGEWISRAGAVEWSQTGTICLEFSQYVFRAWKKPIS